MKDLFCLHRYKNASGGPQWSQEKSLVRGLEVWDYKSIIQTSGNADNALSFAVFKIFCSFEGFENWSIKIEF